MPAAAVGNIPSPWNSIVNKYRDMDIILLVVFYNNNFKINIDDPIDVRRVGQFVVAGRHVMGHTLIIQMTFLLYISTITTVNHPNFINISKLHVACDQQIPTPNWKIGQCLDWNGMNALIGMGPGMHHPHPCLCPILARPVLASV